MFRLLPANIKSAGIAFSSLLINLFGMTYVWILILGIEIVMGFMSGSRGRVVQEKR